MNFNTLEYLIGGLLVLGMLVIGILTLLKPDDQLATGPDMAPAHYQSILAKATAFMQYRQTLNSINLDTSIFQNPLFKSLYSPVPDAVEQPQGKESLFDEAVISDEI